MGFWQSRHNAARSLINGADFINKNAHFIIKISFWGLKKDKNLAFELIMKYICMQLEDFGLTLKIVLTMTKKELVGSIAKKAGTFT
ncbi:MAG: hypothetical protein MZV63_19935 [Marinilabiliales bacterium]|nr:hypothetical protein [Marinilabiliales bacterium]